MDIVKIKYFITWNEGWLSGYFYMTLLLRSIKKNFKCKGFKNLCKTSRISFSYAIVTISLSSSTYIVKNYAYGMNWKKLHILDLILAKERSIMAYSLE
jgi:hypothetical protein